ncbi:hypothetical protein K437DRAFT_257141 [Tilletiaria anomala UBC 951]|uniref:Uncharacterized protein n=1 Tax=Tilletiaria anomala (strain ATCC 24038 / CBS 436.72 / UBC 951) TaxID=1037660 RepID=A0A066W0F9_TILAU|nr:uncharacterized protein K437DRAFT_257141 [Tilletiaria anomala UBC 951]KDN44270.1 hypothetical protein K437DRAFT_257141 [Tilletiaria anomala UBC 951]
MRCENGVAQLKDVLHMSNTDAGRWKLNQICVCYTCYCNRPLQQPLPVTADHRPVTEQR